MDNIDWVKVKARERNIGEEVEVGDDDEDDDSRNSEEPEYINEV